MKTCDIIFGKYYSAEHNECMELMVRRLSGVQVLMEGATADGERMVVVNMDDTAYAILLRQGLYVKMLATVTKVDECIKILDGLPNLYIFLHFI